MTIEHKRRPSIGGGSAFLPIKVLSTYTTRWKIEARVVDLGPVSTFARKQGGGQGAIFNTVLMDSEGTQIGCKFWNEAAEKFHPILQKGKVYSFSRGKIGVANKRYSGTIDHNYEITFDNANDAEIVLRGDPENEIPLERQLQYSSLRSIELSTKALPFMANILVVVHSWQPLREVNIRGESRKVRNLTVVDATQFALDVALWGDDAEAVEEEALQEHQVLSFANIQIRESRGRTATATRATEIRWNVATKEASDLKQWYSVNANTASFKSLSADLVSAGNGQSGPIEASVAEIQERIKDGLAEESLTFKLPAYISSVQYRNPRQDDAVNVIYQACTKCNRKVNEAGPSVHCEKCGTTVASAPRITMSIYLADSTSGGLMVRVFNDTAQILMGLSAQNVATMCEEDPKGIVQLCEYTLPFNRYVFLLRARKDNYNNEARVNLSVGAATPFTPMAAASHSMNAILKLVPNIFDCPPAAKRVCLDRDDDDDEEAKEGFAVADKKQRLANKEATHGDDDDMKENMATHHREQDDGLEPKKERKLADGNRGLEEEEETSTTCV